MNWAYARQEMVNRQLRGHGIYDERVLAAMAEIPREEFVPESHRNAAYANEPAPIGFSQTISQPYMVALMVQCLELAGWETVLEIGGGCGYHAAVLGTVAAHVVTLELIPELAAAARANLERTSRAGNITVIEGDGSRGYSALAPYDGISVAAAAPRIPPELIEQLKDPGRLVMPVGPEWDQALEVLTKSGGHVNKRVAAYCRFVPLKEH